MNGVNMPPLRLDQLRSADTSASPRLDSPRDRFINKQKERTKMLLLERARIDEQRATAQRKVPSPRTQPLPSQNRTVERRLAGALATERARGSHLAQEQKTENQSLQQQLQSAQSSLQRLELLWRQEHQKRCEDSEIYTAAYNKMQIVTALGKLKSAYSATQQTSIQQSVSRWARAMWQHQLARRDQTAELHRLEASLGAAREELQASRGAADLAEREASSQHAIVDSLRAEIAMLAAAQAEQGTGEMAALAMQEQVAAETRAEVEALREALETAERRVQLEQVRCALVQRELARTREEHVNEVAKLYDQRAVAQQRQEQLEASSRALSRHTGEMIALVEKGFRTAPLVVQSVEPQPEQESDLLAEALRTCDWMSEYLPSR